MHVARWGNSLAVRLPKALVEAMGLKAGDVIDLRPAGPGALEIARDDRRAQALARMRARGWAAPDGPIDREAAQRR